MIPEQNSYLHPAWKQAVADFIEANFAYGDMVPLPWLYQVMKVRQPTPETPRLEAAKLDLQFGQQFGCFKDALLTDYLFDLQKDKSGDYLVVRPEDQGPRALKEGMHDLRQAAKKTHKRMTFIAVDRLTDEQRRRDSDALANFSQLRGIIVRPPKLSVEALKQLSPK